MTCFFFSRNRADVLFNDLRAMGEINTTFKVETLDVYDISKGKKLTRYCIKGTDFGRTVLITTDGQNHIFLD